MPVVDVSMVIQERQQFEAMDASYKWNMRISMQSMETKSKIGKATTIEGTKEIAQGTTKDGAANDETAASLHISKEARSKMGIQNISKEKLDTVQDVMKEMRTLSCEVKKENISNGDRFLIQEKMKELKLFIQEVSGNKANMGAVGKENKRIKKEAEQGSDSGYHLNICL